MAIQKIRLSNLRWLMKELNVDSHEVAEKWETSEQYLNQMLGGRHAKIGINIATRIEKAERLPIGWLSTQHEEMKLSVSEDAYISIMKTLHQLNLEDKISLLIELSNGIKEEARKLKLF